MIEINNILKLLSAVIRDYFFSSFIITDINRKEVVASNRPLLLLKSTKITKVMKKLSHLIISISKINGWDSNSRIKWGEVTASPKSMNSK